MTPEESLTLVERYYRAYHAESRSALTDALETVLDARFTLESPLVEAQLGGPTAGPAALAVAAGAAPFLAHAVVESLYSTLDGLGVVALIWFPSPAGVVVQSEHFDIDPETSRSPASGPSTTRGSCSRRRPRRPERASPRWSEGRAGRSGLRRPQPPAQPTCVEPERRWALRASAVDGSREDCIVTQTIDAPVRTRRPTSRLYSVLIGLSTLVVLFQGLWAGLFVQEGEDYKESWVTVHARGADVAIGLALIATVVAIVKLRSRLDIVIASAVFTVLLVLEAYLGGLIGDHSTLTAVHFPLAMALMGLAVWLPIRGSRR